MDTMSVQEAASYLGVTEKTIYRYLDKRKLTSEKIGLVHFIPTHEVEKLALSRHVPTDEKTRLDNRVNTLYELFQAHDYRIKELEEKLAKLQAPVPVQTPQETRSESQETPVQRATRPTSSQGNIPAGYVAFSAFLHGMSPSSAKRNVEMETGDWRDATGHVINRALSPEQQRAFYKWAHDRPGFVACPDCPHTV